MSYLGKTKNPNDNTAHIYDIVNSSLKNFEVLEAELDLIQSLVPKGSSILDIGCGTGRHLIALDSMGYKVKGLDSSKKMLEVLLSKSSSADVQKVDFLDWRSSQKFDLIILMWNSFNEIVLDRSQVDKFFAKVKSLLSVNGKILINIDNAENLDLANLAFSTVTKDAGFIYKQNWEVVKFEAKSKSTLSKEQIVVTDKSGVKTCEYVSFIKQRWWSREELEVFFREYGLTSKCHRLSVNDEIYLVGSLS